MTYPFKFLGILTLLIFCGFFWFNPPFFNFTDSAQKGFYIPTTKERADFITFCVPTGKTPENILISPRFCSDKNPKGIKIVKRIVKHTRDGIIVRGLTNNSIDSRVLGPIPKHLIRGYFSLLISIPAHVSANP